MPQDALSKEIFHPRDIKSQEQRIRIVLGGSAKPSEPVLVNTLVNEKATLAVLWHSSIDDQIFLFPTSKPACEEFEYSTLREWDVIFIGSIKQLNDSFLAFKLKSLPVVFHEDIIFCILAINHYVTSFKQEDMTRMLFPCCLATIAESGKLIKPKNFCNTHWQPARNQQDDLDDLLLAKALASKVKQLNY